jgi:hypothetical protein
MSFLRFLMLLSLIVWVGGLIFFPVVAGTAFSVLPSAHLAGLVVRRSLILLHWMGIVSGAVFLVSSMLYNRMTTGAARIFAGRHVLICLMLVLTLISQFSIIPRMDTLRASLETIGSGEIASVPADNAIRIEFEFLHVWSTRIEGGVLILGLLAAYLTSRPSS